LSRTRRGRGGRIRDADAHATRAKPAGAIVHRDPNRVRSIPEPARIPGREPRVLRHIRRVGELNPILGIAAESDLNGIVIELGHNNRAANLCDAAQRISLARRRDIEPRFDRARIGRERAIRTAVGGRLGDVVINRPLPRFGRINGKDALVHNVAGAIVISQQSIRAINFQLLPHGIVLRRHAFLQENISMPMIGRAHIGRQQP